MERFATHPNHFPGQVPPRLKIHCSLKTLQNGVLPIHGPGPGPGPGPMALWPYGPMALWPYGPMDLWPYSPIAQ